MQKLNDDELQNVTGGSDYYTFKKGVYYHENTETYFYLDHEVTDILSTSVYLLCLVLKDDGTFNCPGGLPYSLYTLNACTYRPDLVYNP